MTPTSAHGDLAKLTASHNRRLASLDPDLDPVAVPDVAAARAVLTAGAAVGVWTRSEVRESDLASLWGGLSQDLLAVRSGKAVAPQLGCLLDQLDLARGQVRPDSDAELVMRLPALEAGVAPSSSSAASGPPRRRLSCDSARRLRATGPRPPAPGPRHPTTSPPSPRSCTR